MPTRTADAEWQGDLRQGKGTMRVGSGAFEGSYSFKSRMGWEGNYFPLLMIERVG
jgi:lipoyl-dependent peroxiredoxin